MCRAHCCLPSCFPLVWPSPSCPLDAELPITNLRISRGDGKGAGEEGTGVGLGAGAGAGAVAAASASGEGAGDASEDVWEVLPKAINKGHPADVVGACGLAWPVRGRTDPTLPAAGSRALLCTRGVSCDKVVDGYSECARVVRAHGRAAVPCGGTYATLAPPPPFHVAERPVPRGATSAGWPPRGEPGDTHRSDHGRSELGQAHTLSVVRPQFFPCVV
jgi:hypothetical protein